MKNDLVVFSSDWHGDGVTAGSERFRDVFAVGEYIVDWAIEQKARAFVFGGDLSDPDSSLVHAALGAFSRLMKRLDDAGVLVWIVPGNHDVNEDSRGSTIYDGLDPWMRVARDPRALEGLPRATLALPYVPRARGYDPAAFVAAASPAPGDGTEFAYVVGHLNAEGATIGSESADFLRGRDVFWPTKALRERFPNAKLIGAHYHKPHEHDGITFGGAPAVLTFGEEGNKPRFLALRAADVESVEVPLRFVRPVVTVRTIADVDVVSGGGGATDSLVRVCSSDPAVMARAHERGIESVVPGPIESPDSAPAAQPGALDFEATARDIASRWADKSPAFNAAVTELVGGVLEQGRT